LSVVDELDGLPFESNAASLYFGCYDERGKPADHRQAAAWRHEG
jgi:hypothetical protein